MQTEDEMTINERSKYLKRMKPLYNQANKGERGELLNQMQQVTGLHRKSLLRLLHARTLERKPRQKQRESSYGAEVEQVILVLWETLDYICAERLTPVLLSTARQLHRLGVMRLTAEVEEQLSQHSQGDGGPYLEQTSFWQAAITARSDHSGRISSNERYR